MFPLCCTAHLASRKRASSRRFQYGITKINVATMLNQAFIAGMKKAIADMPNNIDPRKTLAISRDMVTEVVRHKIRLFGSSGKATSSGYVSAPKSFRAVDLGAVE